jgi:hypothetical protein
MPPTAPTALSYKEYSMYAFHRFLPLAYLDPGSGSIIIQLVIAAVLGLGLVIRTQWTRIKKLFGRKTNEDDERDSED